jgi:hypothetical protein
MIIRLSPRGEELLEAALSRGVGKSPEEVVERALESTATMTSALPEEAENRRDAVAQMMAFRHEFHFSLGPGLSVTDLIREGREY